MSATGEDGDPMNFIDTVEDINGETPENAAMRRQLSAKMMGVLMALPKQERNAFYFRVECGYDWITVAKLLGCSIPTAREYVKRSLEKLQGVRDE
jgi:DNA-directed RNA polymerase specialized sigma24 family protein